MSDGENNDILNVKSEFTTYEENRERAFDLVFNQNKSIFLEGPGGCGKTYLMKELRQYADEHELQFYMTALTGAAAVGVRGTTVHSYAGVGYAREDAEELIKLVRFKTKVSQRWRKTQYLAIDEVSMLSAELLEKLNAVAQAIRNDDRPFGGITLILSGDFFQLPPVKAKFCFESATWRELNLIKIRMMEPKRYPDINYYKMLLRIRKGDQTKDDIKCIKSRVTAFRNLKLDDMEIKPTRLYPTKNKAEIHNNSELSKIPISGRAYRAKDECYKIVKKRGKIISSDQISLTTTSTTEKIFDDLAPAEIRLKIGAQVMLTVNIDFDLELINGSRGVVTALEAGLVTVKFNTNDRIVDKFVEKNSREDWTKNTQKKYNIQLINKNTEESENGNEKEISMDTSIQVSDKINTDEIANDGIELTLGRVGGDAIHEDILYVRWQIPLIVAWAITIHKSQGSSLDCVIGSLGKDIFEHGQAYVLMSRVRRLDGLYLIACHPDNITANPKVLDYDKNDEQSITSNNDEYSVDEVWDNDD